MEGTWWRKRQEIDTEQEAIISLPFDGKYLVIGPPGCGKTNILVLRAAYMSKSGFKDLMLLTFGSVLSGFINTGRKELDADQIATHWSWASDLASRVPGYWDRINATKSLGKWQQFEARRQIVMEDSRKGLAAPGYSGYVHQVILVDEVQDLTSAEVDVLNDSTPRLMFAGDVRQSIYHGDGLPRAKALGFQVKKLTAHYRMGKAIARVADRLHPPKNPGEGLEATTNYDETTRESRAKHREFPDRAKQFEAMLKEIRIQLRAYPDETLAILVPRRVDFDELETWFDETEVAHLVAYHRSQDSISLFRSDARIHVMTINGAKGTEFRVVHLYACEAAQGRQDTTEFWYTAVTRAKTTLLAYSSPSSPGVSRKLLAAFAENTNPSVDSLFDE